MSADHRAVIRRSYYQGWTNAQIAEDLQIPEGNGEVQAALRDADAPGWPCRRWGVTR